MAGSGSAAVPAEEGRPAAPDGGGAGWEDRLLRTVGLAGRPVPKLLLPPAHPPLSLEFLAALLPRPVHPPLSSEFLAALCLEAGWSPQWVAGFTLALQAAGWVERP
jgi:hypothetical protein